MPGGVLVVDKPSGPTSFDVVQRVRRALGAAKAGHTGTLDPLATGVLAVCLDDAVKLQQFLVAGDKAYEAEVVFGAATDTEDAQGTVTEERDASALGREALLAALPRFVGELEQVPPMYSAVRVGGRRLHEAARAGEEVERGPRKVVVHALELLSFEAGPRARARIAVRCGKGTYVRTLAADLGRALGFPAHLAALRRTEAGPFRLDQAVTLDEVVRGDREALRARVVPLAGALGHLPAVKLAAAQARDLQNGKQLDQGELPDGLARALSEGGELIAVCSAGGGRLKPVRVLTRA